jgi:DNA-binding protein H-NS
MAEIDLNALSLDELKKLHRATEKAIGNFENRRLLAARAALEEKASELGVTLEGVMAIGGKVSRKRASSQARFRNPDDHAQTWTGQGRRPGWFVAAIERGLSPEDLSV